MINSMSYSCIVRAMAASEQMTQIVLDGAGGPDRLSVQQAAVPDPGPGQVLIRVEAAGVGFNDITTREGRNPGALPRVLGYDVVGHVVAAGAGVTALAPGQRVAALVGTGGYASHVVAQAERAVPVGSQVDAAQVDALVLNYATAWQLLHRATRIVSGQSILIVGAAGGVGSALVELALLEGATVYGTSSPARRETVEAAGAHWVASAADLPVPVDAVFDPVGGPSLHQSRRATRRGGVVVGYGFSFTVATGLSKYGGLARTLGALMRARLTPGPRMRLYLIERSISRDPAAYREDLAHLVGMLDQGRIHPMITTLPLTEAAQAHRRLQAREVIGKLVLIPGDPK